MTDQNNGRPVNKKLRMIVGVFGISLGVGLAGYLFYKNADHALLSQDKEDTESTEPEAGLSVEGDHQAKTDENKKGIFSSLLGSGSPSGKEDSQQKEMAKKEIEPDQCFQETFKHKNLSSHRDGEKCTQHKNQITLKRDITNKSSVCVKVNGTPVKHKIIAANRIEIGPVAGPNSEITVRHCTKKNLCKDACKVPKDQFLSALGGLGSGNSNSLVAWDDSQKKHQKKEKAVDREVKEFSKVLSQEGAKTTFTQWLRKSEESVCTKSTATVKHKKGHSSS